MKKIIFTLVFYSLLFGTISNAGDDYHKLTPYKGTPEFEKMKTLAGTWKGTTKMGEEEKEITVTYNTASADSVVVERIFPGTPEEMVSIYFDKDGKLSMTHYCALKNQPHMTLKDSNENKIDMAFSGGSNFDHTKDPHMHSMSIDFVDENNIVQNWAMYDKGKENHKSTFELTKAN